MTRPATSRRARGAPIVRVLRWVVRRWHGLFGGGTHLRQSLVALALNSLTSLVAGATLGSITGTLDRFPGLLVLVPAAIGLRGNIFSTFGTRVSTLIHTGEFEFTLRPSSPLRQNVDASMLLTTAMSVVLAVMAWVIGRALGVTGLASPLRLATISALGGLLASVVVLAASMGLVAGAVRRGWDLDNVVAPVVSTLGDVLTLPALWAAALVAERPVAGLVVGALIVVLGVLALAVGVRSHRPALRRVVRQSWPILTAAAVLSSLGGLVLERRLDALTALPALLMLQPAFVSSAGALGGILAARTSSLLHLGLVAPTWWPEADVRADALAVGWLFLPVAVLNGAGAHAAAGLLGRASPGLLTMVGLSVLGGAAAMLVALGIAYASTVAAVELDVDPDTYGIPAVTSVVDVGGVAILLAVAAAMGIVAG